MGKGRRHRFALQGFNSFWGETIVVVGSTAELGNWDPQRGLELCCKDDGRQWEGDALISTSHSSFEYKYVVIRRVMPNGAPSTVVTSRSEGRGNSESFHQKHEEIRHKRNGRKREPARRTSYHLWEQGPNRVAESTGSLDAVFVHGDNWRGPSTSWPQQKLSFSLLRPSDLHPLDKLKVVGSIGELGDWNPDYGVLLTPAGNGYLHYERPRRGRSEDMKQSEDSSLVQRFSGDISFREGPEAVEYKYVVERYDHYEWEQGPNRVISALDSKTSFVDDVWAGAGSEKVPKRLVGFSVISCPNQHGDYVCVVGSDETVGAWKSENGLRLHCRLDDSGVAVWEGAAYFRSSTQQVEYKYVLMRDDEGKVPYAVDWEKGYNRHEALTGTSVLLVDQWRRDDHDKGKADSTKTTRSFPTPAAPG